MTHRCVGPAKRRLDALRALFGGLALLTLPHALRAQLGAEAIARIALPTVARIIGFDENDRPMRQGSGFLVGSPGRIVTNAHVLRGASRLRVQLSEGRTFEVVRVLAYEPGVDLAVIEIPGGGLPSLRLAAADTRPPIGATVFVVGNPLGLDRTFSDGLVSGYRQRGRQQLMQISAPISPGSSGGPVLGSDGRVIGVATATLAEGQNLNLAIPARQVREILSVARSRREPLSLPLGDRIESADAVDDVSEIVAAFRSYPLIWTTSGARSVLGTPAEVSMANGPTRLTFSRTFLGARGVLAVFIDVNSGKSYGQFVYYMPRSQCVAEHDRLGLALTARFGPAVTIQDENGACALAIRAWEDRQANRRFTVMTSPSVALDGSLETIVYVMYGESRQ